MSSTAKVIRPHIAPGRRVLAISDIHGNLPFFRGVLEKAKFSPEDVLILVGDLFEKGEESLNLLRHLMHLSQTHTVYPLCGNCDHLDLIFLEGRPGIDEALWPVFRTWDRRSLILQMGAELGLHPRGPEDLPQLRQAILEQMPREVAYLRSMAHILEAGRYIFVHGGIDREEDMESLPAYGCMKNDNFVGQNRRFSRWVVVGHWPVTLYRTDMPVARPWRKEDQHIVSIDGGCVLKVDGQLNALIIPDVNRDDMDHVAYDGLPVVTALEEQWPSQDSFNIRWSDSVVEVLEEQEDVCLCRHSSTGREMWILRDYLYTRQSDGLTHTEDTTDYELPVKPGERLTLVAQCSLGYLVKKDGVTGWYRGDIQRPPESGVN